MNFFRQFLALLRMSLSAVTRRPGSVLTIVIGVMCAVAVLVSMLSMGSGARRQVLAGVREDRVVVTSHGASGILSSISRDEAETVRGLPGIKRGSDGKPVVDFQSIVIIEARRRITGRRTFFPLIGVTRPPFADAHSELHLTEGRSFQPGLHELLASTPCVRQFTGFALGDKRPIGGADWTVVGHYDEQDVQQCVVLADAEVLMSAFNSNTYTQATATMSSVADYGVLRRALEQDPSLHLEVKHESEAREEGIRQLNGLLNFAAYFVGSIMAIGATLGAVNSLYSIVDSRRREIATLRAIGFGSAAVAASILCESILLALPGALLGVLLAWALFHRMAVSPFGFSFLLDVTPRLAVIGVVWALAMGLLGGLLPAVRAARVPVTTALRAA
jgi:putative ABC transport system permease protein